jgi:hypothetical protein
MEPDQVEPEIQPVVQDQDELSEEPASSAPPIEEGAETKLNADLVRFHSSSFFLSRPSYSPPFPSIFLLLIKYFNLTHLFRKLYSVTLTTTPTFQITLSFPTTKPPHQNQLQEKHHQRRQSQKLARFLAARMTTRHYHLFQSEEGKSMRISRKR